MKTFSIRIRSDGVTEQIEPMQIDKVELREIMEALQAFDAALFEKMHEKAMEEIVAADRRGAFQLVADNGVSNRVLQWDKHNEKGDKPL
jgi:uncharacterized protein YqgV (UPF0045/DUF77 family)